MKLRDYIQKELEDAEYYNTHCPGYTGVYHIMYRNSNLVSFKMPHNANGEELALFNGDPGANGIMLCYSSNPPTDPNELCYNKKTNKFTQIPNHLNVKDINGNTLLNELESIIDTISQISSYQSNNANYLSQNATMTQNINSAKQRTTDFQTQASRLQTQVNSFQISDDISTLNAKQKAHILQKIWGNDDIRQRTDEYVNMFNSINRQDLNPNDRRVALLERYQPVRQQNRNINDLKKQIDILSAIKQQGFDPHYVNQSGQSLIGTALGGNDITLFDLLISNNLNFNNVIAEKTIFQMVLVANNNNLTNKMYATNQDFSKSVLSIGLDNDKVTLNKIFSRKPELSKVNYAGYSLLQLTLKKGSYDAAEEILKISTDTINQLNSNNLSSIQLCLLWSNNQGVELLKRYGANLTEELKIAIDKRYVNVINKILDKEPELIKSVVNLENNQITESLLQNSKLLHVSDSNGNNLLHLACKAGKYELASKILECNAACINQQNNAGKTVFHTLLESSLESTVKAQFAELFLIYHPNINISDSEHHTITDLATELNPDILTMLYEHNLMGDNNS